MPDPSYAAEFDPGDYVAARRLSLTPRRIMRLILWVWVAILVPFCVWLTYFGWVRGRWHPLLLPMAGAGAFLAFYFYVVLPWIARQGHRPEPAAGHFTDAGVVSDQLGLVEWNRLRKWKRNDRILVFYSSGDAFLVVPLRAFATAADRTAAIALLERKLGAAD
jgi:hypothetical protein